nr:hypothetical protein HmN_000381800 [Hymenolepis microstoma]
MTVRSPKCGTRKEASAAATNITVVNELDSKTFQKSVSDEEWLKALGKDDEKLTDCKYELYNQICESYKLWEKANRECQKVLSHRLVETKRSRTHLSIFDELKVNEPSSPPQDDKENILHKLRKMPPEDLKGQSNHYSSNDSMKPLYASSPKVGYIKVSRPQNIPILKMTLTPINLGVPYESKELREALWGNSDENWDSDLKFPLYEQICEAYKQYNLHFKSSTSHVQKVEQVDPRQQEKPKVSSNHTINILKILRNEVEKNSEDEEDFVLS